MKAGDNTHPLHDPRADNLHRRAQKAEGALLRSERETALYAFRCERAEEALMRMRAKRDKWRDRYRDVADRGECEECAERNRGWSLWDCLVWLGGAFLAFKFLE